MLVQINTDRNIEGPEELATRVEAKIRSAADRYGNRLTRVEAHLGDENSGQKAAANDKRCLLEARAAGLRPIAVSHQADSLDLAIDGALDKLERALESTLGRLKER